MGHRLRCRCCCSRGLCGHSSFFLQSVAGNSTCSLIDSLPAAKVRRAGGSESPQYRYRGRKTHSGRIGNRAADASLAGRVEAVCAGRWCYTDVVPGGIQYRSPHAMLSTKEKEQGAAPPQWEACSWASIMVELGAKPIALVEHWREMNVEL